MSSEIEKLSLSQLLDRYVDISLRQAEASDANEISLYNRLLKGIGAISDELRSRPGDQRDLLLGFLTHPVAQVRFNAAMQVMSISPTLAKKEIERIAASGDYPIAGAAGTYLMMLEANLK